jgi:hypothetical protein
MEKATDDGICYFSGTLYLLNVLFLEILIKPSIIGKKSLIIRTKMSEKEIIWERAMALKEISVGRRD